MNIMLLIWIAMIDGQYMSTAVEVPNYTVCKAEKKLLEMSFTKLQARHYVECKQVKLKDAM